MPFSTKLITITTAGSWGPGDDYQISLVLQEDTYVLRGKIIRVDELHQDKKILRKNVKVTREWAAGILDELRNATIPLLPPKVLGCDGTFYSMSVGSPFGGATYSWWSDAPDGWEVLPKVTGQIITKFLEPFYPMAC
jgi:hypothetical protein